MLTMLSGLILLMLVLRDVFQTVLVPRAKGTNLRLAPFLVRSIVWPPYRWLAGNITAPVWQSEFLGIFAPFMIVILLTAWIVLLVVAFGLILLAHSKDMSPPLDSLSSAVYMAGSFVLTVGSSDYVGKTTTVRFIMLAAAFTGVIITASVVSLLFTLIAAFQRREVLVTITANIAGSPPSGIAILEALAFLKGRQSLTGFYDDWQRWCADVLESHRAYPLLIYFYSTDVSTSWLTCLGAVLDSAALLLSTEPDVDLFSARLTYQLGTKLLNEVGDNCNLVKTPAFDVSEEDFTTLCLRLQKANYALSTEATAKQEFNKLRRNYTATHQAIAAYISVPPTPLLTEHSIPFS